MTNVPHVDDVAPVSHAAKLEALARVADEIDRIDRLAREGRFGGSHIVVSGPNFGRLSVLLEEVGEAATEVNEETMLVFKYDHGIDGRELDPDAHLAAIEDRRGRLLGELVQVAAVAALWIAAEVDRELPLEIEGDGEDLPQALAPNKDLEAGGKSAP